MQTDREKFAYSINEVTERGPFGRSTIFQEIKDGRLVARKVGRRTIILHNDFVKWLEDLPKRQQNWIANDLAAPAIAISSEPTERRLVDSSARGNDP